MPGVPSGYPSLIWTISLALYAIGWLALIVAPMRHRFCWILARSCAVTLALTHVGVIFAAGAPLTATDFLLSAQAGKGLAALLPLVLFVGSWQVEDSALHGIPHRFLLPVLVLTAGTGPLGFIVHIAMRDVFKIRNARALSE